MVVEATIKVRFECPVDTGLVDGCQLAQEEAVKTGRVSDIHILSYLTRDQIQMLRHINEQRQFTPETLGASMLCEQLWKQKLLFCQGMQYCLTTEGHAELRALR